MQVSSFISSFKKITKKIAFPVAVILFVVVLWLTNQFFTWLLLDDVSRYTRVTLHEMYTQENIDVLFIGSSHCYRSLDTEITDEIFGKNTFNAGTSSQQLDGSYALLVEAGKSNDIEQVYLELYYNVVGNVYENRTDLTSTYIISDYMKPSLNKISYLINASTSEYWANSFFPARRNWSKLFESMYVSKNVTKKLQDSYQNYEYPSSSNEYYAGKGYVANTTEIVNNNFSNEGHFASISENAFSEDSLNSLLQIITYCGKNDIELVIYSAPMPEFRLVDVGNYDDYIEQVSALCATYGILYYDFNLCREEYFSFDCSYFKDSDHLNKNGAEVFSELFATFFTGGVNESDLFYESYEEKINTKEPQTYGIIYTIDTTESVKTITLNPVQSGDVTAYYTVLKQAGTEGEYVEILSGTELSDIEVPGDETGQLLIRVYSDAEGACMTNEISFSY